jgi:predicted small secreted protein
MKKTILSLTLILISILSLTACNQKKDVAIDVEALATEATKGAEFREAMQELNDDTVINIYSSLNLSDVEKYKVFVNSTGGKADELAIFKAKDTAKAEEIYKAVKERIEDLKFAFEGYVPEELQYIENAVVKKDGKYVMMAISQKYEKVNEIFTKHLKGGK